MQLINDPGNTKMALAPKENIDNAKCTSPSPTKYTDLFKEIYLQTDQEVQVLEEGCKV